MPIEIVTGAAAQANVASEPCNVMLYGAPGTLKTTDAVSAFMKNGRCTAFVIPCEDGSLQPIVSRGLAVPDHVRKPVKTWQDMTEAMTWLAQNRNQYNAVIVDTLSTFTMYLARDLEEQFKGNKNKFAMWGVIRNCLFALREWSRVLGMHCVFIAHSQAPEVKDGVFYRGGPQLAPKTMINEYYGLLDTVLRVDYVTLPMSSIPTRVYWTGGTEFPKELGGAMFQPPVDWQFWRTKNRAGCADAIVPADLGAFLRRRQPPYANL